MKEKGASGDAPYHLPSGEDMHGWLGIKVQDSAGRWVVSAATPMLLGTALLVVATAIGCSRQQQAPQTRDHADTRLRDFCRNVVVPLYEREYADVVDTVRSAYGDIIVYSEGGRVGHCKMLVEFLRRQVPEARSVDPVMEIDGVLRPARGVSCPVHVVGVRTESIVESLSKSNAIRYCGTWNRGKRRAAQLIVSSQVFGERTADAVAQPVELKVFLANAGRPGVTGIHCETEGVFYVENAVLGRNLVFVDHDDLGRSLFPDGSPEECSWIRICLAGGPHSPSQVESVLTRVREAAGKFGESNSPQVDLKVVTSEQRYADALEAWRSQLEGARALLRGGQWRAGSLEGARSDEHLPSVCPQ